MFIKEALIRFRTQGSVFPSSKFLTERMLEPLQMKDGVCIVELGAGTGAFTQTIISRMPPRSTLLVFEINHTLADHLRKTIRDPRVTIIEDDAAHIGSHLKRLGLRAADYVISGLPLGNFPYQKRHEILSAIHDNLDRHGIYMQFQYFLASWFHIRALFDTTIIGYEFRNIPPAFLYRCTKRAQSDGV